MALCGAIARLLDREVQHRLRAAQAAAQGLVGVSMRSGVYRGLSTWHTVTREFWDELGESGAFMNMDREWLLAHLRESASDFTRCLWGVEVNPATWSHTIYDKR